MGPGVEFVSGEHSPSIGVATFEPHPLLRNPHLATAVAAYWPRNCSRLPAAVDRYFEVEPGTRLLAKCHWQESPKQCPTLVLIHGFQGSSESSYMLGIGERAFQLGFNVLRMNQRNCGGTEHLTPTLHNSGLSNDYRAILEELISEDALPEIFFVGYSIGGNLVLKMAGELESDAPTELRGMCAVSPCLDLASCSTGSGAPRNFLYEWYFLRCVRSTLEKKAKLFPGRYHVQGLPQVQNLHEWHERVLAPAWGYDGAMEYYQHESALPVVGQIRVPTLILAAQDDPFIPFESFRHPTLAKNPFIRLVTPEHGGHCAFISNHGGPERFWAESRVVEFCAQRSAVRVQLPS
jgi:predicted alpha/beta-fold hydrolase